MLNMLCSIIDNVANSYGNDFFNKMALSLNEFIKAERLIIATVDHKKSTVSSLATTGEHGLEDNFSYGFINTPSAETITGPTYYDDNVCATYPEDTLLRALNISTYLGIPIYNAEDDCIGLLIAMYQKPINHHEQIFELFTALSGRVSAEISHAIKQNAIEHKLAQLNKIKEQITQELNITKSQLQESEKMATLGNLVAGITHEVNTPLGISITTHSIMMGELKSLDEKIKSEKLTMSAMSHYIEATESALVMQGDNLERAKKLIENFKKTAADQHRLEMENINIKDYYQKVISTLRSLLKPKQVTLTISCEDNITATTYPGIHAQIVTNLISNSVRHAFKDTNEKQGTENSITIKINKKTEHEVEVHYYDNGAGLSDEASKHVFEPFYTTARDIGGLGLGMSIVSKLIQEKLNGTISVAANTADSKGAHFIYTFETTPTH